MDADANQAPGTAHLVRIRDEPTIALAEYRRQLDDVVFEPEGEGVTPAMRAEHRAAVDAAERAASWIEKISETRDKEIYAAIGAGRKALIRLAAMREHRTVPLSLLTDDELSGYLDAATDVHTEDRFRWEGTEDAEFLLDRPEFGRPVFVEVVPTQELQSTMYVVKVQRTDRMLKDVDEDLLYEPGMVYRRGAMPLPPHIGRQDCHAAGARRADPSTSCRTASALTPAMFTSTSIFGPSAAITAASERM